MLLLALLLAAAAPNPPPAAADIVAASPPAAWRAVPADDLLLLDTARGTLVVQLAPSFAPAHVAAIRAQVRAGDWTGGAVVRVQDNYVVQFAAREAKRPPAAPLPAEYDRPAAGLAFRPLGHPDAYAEAGHVEGWPAARARGRVWLAHCYGMVGVGRENPPDVGDGRELYAVIGHAPRHLDRNLAVVGRVLDGLPAWAALPRGTEALGFYKTPAERLPIARARLAADLPTADRPRFEVMDTAAPAFAGYLDARANRAESFFVVPAGGVDLCNAPVPVRRAK